MEANKEQLQAIQSNSDRILCLAGAGAGKTKTMIERISRLTKEGVAPSSILALTFTNAAAAEMRERYEKNNMGMEIPEFRTFHSFCYSIICKDPAIRDAMGYTSIPMICSDEQEKAVEEKAKTQCKITLSADKLKFRKNLNKKEQYQVELYDKAVDRLMRSENIITFDRLNNEVAELFSKNTTATEPYKNKYKYIFVDEFQDTDPHQVKFLNSFPNANFYFCGDCLQNIYSFRGTSNEYIKALANSDGWEIIKLFTNYRSTNQICEYANKFSKQYADASYRIEMKGVREGSPVVTKLVSSPPKFSPISDKHLDDVMQIQSELSGTTAILCRTNKEVLAVCDYLTEKGIAYTTSKDTNIQNLIECALSDNYMLDWLASYLPSNKYGEYIRLATQVEKPDLFWFLGIYGKIPQISHDVNLVHQLQSISNSQDDMEDKLVEVSELFNISVKPTEINYYGAEFLNYIKESIINNQSAELYVGTIHSVKGLEYDNVFILNVGSYTFRLMGEDMMNLFYVAVTRAKYRLYIYRLFD